MPDPLHRVTIHHEGAGDPTNVPRGAKGGYTYWLGTDRWIRLRSAYVSYATLHYNHVSVDICLSGERNGHPVTDSDLTLLSQICADARLHGELVQTPDVYPHRATFSTNCPGDRTMDRWQEVRAACIVPVVPKPKPPPPPKVLPMYNPPFDINDVAASIDRPEGGAWVATSPGAFYGFGSAPYPGSLHDKVFFAGQRVARLELPNAAEKADGYHVIAIAESGNRYGVK